MNRILILVGVLLLVGISAGTSYIHGTNGLLAKVNDTEFTITIMTTLAA